MERAITPDHGFCGEPDAGGLEREHWHYDLGMLIGSFAGLVLWMPIIWLVMR